MKCFTIRPTLEQGIHVDPTGRVVVGESGRGRSQVVVPPPPGAVIEGGKLLEVPPRVEDGKGAAVLLIRDLSGFRGSWSLHADPGAAWYPARDAARAAHKAALQQGTLPEGHSVGFYPCMACNPERPPIVWGQAARLIAAGRRAQGQAGAAGGGPEYLLVLREGYDIEAVRTGRLYGAPSVLRIQNRGGNVQVVDVAAEQASATAAGGW